LTEPGRDCDDPVIERQLCYSLLPYCVWRLPNDRHLAGEIAQPVDILKQILVAADFPDAPRPGRARSSAARRAGASG